MSKGRCDFAILKEKTTDAQGISLSIDVEDEFL